MDFNIDIYIKDMWFYIGLLLCIFSFSKNSAFTRAWSNFLFLSYLVIVSLRSEIINHDTMNYIEHFKVASQQDFTTILFTFTALGFEPAYNIIVFLLSTFCNEREFIFIITIIPSILITREFIKYKYHPSVVFFFHASIILVSSAVTIRHYWAIAIAFIILNSIILKEKDNSILKYFAIPLFHYSTIPLTFVLLYNKLRARLTYKHLLFLFILVIVAFVFSQNFIYSLYLHAHDRLVGGMSANGGLRNLVNLSIVFLILFSASRFSLIKSRMNFLLVTSIVITILLIPFYGLNRITTFFALIIIIHFQKYQGRKSTVNILLLNLISIVSFLFFYFKQTILGGAG